MKPVLRAVTVGLVALLAFVAVADANDVVAGSAPAATGTPTPTPTASTAKGAGVVGSNVILAAQIGPGNRVDAATVMDAQCVVSERSFTYDSSGSLRSKTDPEVGTTSFTYDDRGHLRHVDLPDGTSIDYQIDAAGRRVGKVVNGQRVQAFLYLDGLRPIAELDGNNVVTGVYVYALHANVPDYIERGANRYRIITDPLGSVRLVIDATTGTIVQRMDYDEWGNVTYDYVAPNFTRVPFGYAGGLYDPDTKLVRFGARDYLPETGGWVSRDPIGFGGGDGNLYAYAGGDPVNGIDSDGLSVMVRCPASGCSTDVPFLGPDAELAVVGTVAGEVAGGLVKRLVGRVLARVFPARFGPLAAKELTNAASGMFNQTLTNAGRALTKHPEVIGLTKDTLRTVLRADPALNQAGAEAVKSIVTNGVRSLKQLPRYGNVVEYKLAGGFGARWYADGQKLGEFIGFINP